ncbi:SURF6-domain-containing protein [Aureobasidium pullulans]|uniref:SURF6-domain-containing protein n=1 Tax=Aureobasidium pullulans TaxID=5580 RepID=A0A4S8S4Z2_AURPU|nr:SURF6-domain-containing protein [Aureobasidium pullulans]THW71952.1 SURF6-domain-containing protein [Aureobasidium pullulans]THY01311.1 SURF6-domain-containing protein [Aureobasidium pullulans]THY54752.1 SURF6-domain-containing protein [Aureobasidium pullulans]TIA05614.1 SURF6-domain-containing protein [Aureobasidium pullulans]
MADDLEARLESHAQAFEGLLSLIPANEYYSKDNSDQWQRKKQTKEQKRQAKRAKLDPANQKSAKDVMDENERKRKRELGIDEDDEDSSAQIDLPADADQPSKKQKVDEEDDSEDDDADATSSSKKTQADKRKEKRRLKKEKADKQKAKLDAKKAARKQEPQSAAGAEESADEEMEDAGNESVDEAADDAMDFSGLVDNDETSTPASPEQASVFDNSANQSATSSSSSIVPASNPTEGDATTTTKPKKALALKLPEVNAEELQARLKARIEALRAQRKADGPNGAAPRNRQELLESRRKKEEARKQHKKELRLKAKEEEERLNNERLRGSGSPLATPDIFSPRAVDENNFSFGRVAFDDEETDPTLGSIAAHKKKKGPSDVKTALAAAEKKAQRLAGMDEEKRKEIEEKDMWLNAKKRAHGERVKDDQSLLKKTLKRKTDQKTKSATQWNERLDNVKKGKEMKDKKRTENLNKRRDEKGSKKGGKKGSSSGGAKKKARPGFEGRFKA